MRRDANKSNRLLEDSLFQRQDKGLARTSAEHELSAPCFPRGGMFHLYAKSLKVCAKVPACAFLWHAKKQDKILLVNLQQAPNRPWGHLLGRCFHLYVRFAGLSQPSHCCPCAAHKVVLVASLDLTETLEARGRVGRTALKSLSFTPVGHRSLRDRSPCKPVFRRSRDMRDCWKCSEPIGPHVPLVYRPCYTNGCAVYFGSRPR